MARHESARISPTAHYTGYVWFRNHMAHPAFETRAGRLLFYGLQPWNLVSRAIGGPTLEDMLLARHRAIDALLVRAIERGEVGQVVELAAGLSPRGHRLMERFGARGLVYIESDLPAMCARKRALLERAGICAPGHHVIEIDALAADGPASLAAAAAPKLDRSRGTAVVIEGLLNYFDRATALDVLGRVARFLADYPGGICLSDTYLDDQVAPVWGTRAFLAALSTFARGRVHVHFSSADVAGAALLDCGFARAEVRPAAEILADADVMGDQARRHPPAPVSVLVAAPG